MWFRISGLISNALLLTVMLVSLSLSDLLKYPFDADFSVKTARYSYNGFSGFVINIINNDKKSFDSLDVCIYFRSRDGFEKELATFLSKCIIYQANALQKIPDSTLSNQLMQSIFNENPKRIENTFRSVDSTYAFSLRLPLVGIAFGPQAGIRIDLRFIKRKPNSESDTLKEPSGHQISNADWTFGPHTKSVDDLIDFTGVNIVAIDDMDKNIWNFQTNYYVTINRNGVLLWGIPPNWQLFYDKNKFVPTDIRSIQDPMPYAPIAVPFNEYEEQLIRDSANLHISPLRVNQAGYRPEDKKYFYCVTSEASTFSILNTANGVTVGSGALNSTGLSSTGQLKIRASNNALFMSGGDTKYILQSASQSGTIFEGVIPDLPEGRYKITVGTDTSAPFIIRHDVYNMVKNALLKFFGVNRCGDSKSWFHPPCHLQDAVTGGWHDCGDHLKEGATMSYTAAVLGLAAAAFSTVDQDLYNADQSKTIITDCFPDILYEAKHGADFVLRSYDLAGGDVSKMITSIGGFGNTGCGDDHMWWGPPELQDQMPSTHGGPPRCARSEPTTDYLAKYAANLAFVSKRIRLYDAAYADKCLKTAIAIYDFTKVKLNVTNTSAYNGATIVTDDAAFGCLALLWATGERKYLDELCYDKTIGKKASNNVKLFQGGWFTATDPIFSHNAANTDWASSQPHVLWGFYKLILSDTALCAKMNLTSQERLALIEKTVYNLSANIASLGLGNQSIQLPENGIWVPPIIKYELPWFTMHTQMEWVWNRYQAGNITEMYYYYDIASRIQGTELPNTPATANWRSSEVKTVLIRMLDYMLGVNPWDISMIYGVGSKNFNHPHHRASNPELRNCTADYHYRHLVGALQGGYQPNSPIYSEQADDYMHSEVGINGTTNILMPVLGLCASDHKVSNRNIVLQSSQSIPVIHIISSQTDGILIKSTKPLRTAILYTISGQLVKQQQVSTSQPLSISMPHTMTSGMYLLQVVCADGSRVMRKVQRTFR